VQASMTLHESNTVRRSYRLTAGFNLAVCRMSLLKTKKKTVAVLLAVEVRSSMPNEDALNKKKSSLMILCVTHAQPFAMGYVQLKPLL